MAAADFIPENLGVRFIPSSAYGLDSMEELLSNPPSPNDAQSIRQLFGSNRLNSLLKSTVTGGKSLVVSDFDGTLFHKDSVNRTQRSISAFMTYPVRVICSSRSIPELLNKCRELAIEPDYFIGWGGAVITDLKGEVIWIRDLSESESKLLEVEDQTAQPRSFCEKVIQYSSCVEPTKTLKVQFSIQEFQSKFYFNSKSATKLLATIKLLDIIDWKGLVEAFGDGQYDLEYLKYFDGTLVTLDNSPLSYLKSAPSITRNV
jgi:hydroxymethylpyrimidine pyrophosphatase-like HAD family hydrolase